MLKGLQDGSTPRRSSVTLGEFLDDWLAVQRERIRPTTWHGYEISVDRIKRHLGKATLVDKTNERAIKAMLPYGVS